MGEAVQEHVHLKPQIAERTRQRKRAALRKFVCKSEDALKRKKNKRWQAAAESGKSCVISFIAGYRSERRKPLFDCLHEDVQRE